MKCSIICKRILDLVVKNFDYFREQPKHLAWVMMHYEMAHRIGRIYFNDCRNNPKYPIIDAGDNILKNEEDANLLYDAWGVCVSNDIAFPDINGKESNPKKTLQDYYDICLDPDYSFHSIFPNKKAVDNHLLCTNGNGMGWTKDGYLDHLGPSGIPDYKYAGYTKVEAEVPKKFREQVLNYFKSSGELIKAKRKFMRIIKINWGDNRAEQEYINNKNRITHIIDKDKSEPRKRKISSLKRREKEVLKAFRYVCYFEQIVKRARRWTPEEWKEAKKKDYLEYHNFRISIDEIDIGMYINSYSFHSNLGITIDLERMEELENIKDFRLKNNFQNERFQTWRDFVWKLKRCKTKEFQWAKKNFNHPSVKSNKEDERKASEILDKYRPNKEKYEPIYNKAIKGDERAAATLNGICKLPKKGWESFVWLVKEQPKRFDKFMKKINRKEKEKHKIGKYYPLCEYACMIEMPKNAHSSYVKASIRIAKEIIKDPDDRNESKKWAKKFLKNWGVKLAA